MKLSHAWIISSVFVVIAVAVGVWLYPHLPARVPDHWDLAGHVDGWTSRWWAVATPVLVLLGLMLLTWLLPVISPRRFEITPFARVYTGLMLVIEGVIVVISVCVLLAGAGYAVPMQTVVVLAVGALLLILGNYMGKLRKNFFIGIRTPWTLASDAVWERTHRLGGWVLMLAGVVYIVLALVGVNQVVLVIVIVVAALLPALYSFVIYKRLERRGQLEGEDP